MDQGDIEIEHGFADKPYGLHDDGLNKRDAVPDRVRKGKQVRDIPHEEEDSQGADEGGPGNAGYFKGRSVSCRRDKKNGRALQVEKGDNANQNTGDIERFCF